MIAVARSSEGKEARTFHCSASAPHNGCQREISCSISRGRCSDR